MDGRGGRDPGAPRERRTPPAGSRRRPRDDQGRRAQPMGRAGKGRPGSKDPGSAFCPAGARGQPAPGRRRPLVVEGAGAAAGLRSCRDCSARAGPGPDRSSGAPQARGGRGCRVRRGSGDSRGRFPGSPRVTAGRRRVGPPGCRHQGPARREPAARALRRSRVRGFGSGARRFRGGRDALRRRARDRHPVRGPAREWPRDRAAGEGARGSSRARPARRIGLGDQGWGAPAAARRPREPREHRDPRTRLELGPRRGTEPRHRGPEAERVPRLGLAGNRLEPALRGRRPGPARRRDPPPRHHRRHGAGRVPARRPAGQRPRVPGRGRHASRHQTRNSEGRPLATTTAPPPSPETPLPPPGRPASTAPPSAAARWRRGCRGRSLRERGKRPRR